MARKFPLEGLLRVRTIWEDRAAADLAEAHRLEQRAHDRAAETARILGSNVPPARSGSAGFQAAVAARAAMSALLVEAQLDVTAAQQVTAERTVAWSAARRATRSVERLAERHKEAERLAEERAEQQILDEMAGRRAAEAL